MVFIMKKNNFLQLCITKLFILFFFSFLFVGCSKTQEEKLSSDNETPAMGRYIESEYSFPDNSLMRAFHQTKDNTYEILCQNPKETLTFISRDYGKTWEENTPDWVKKLNRSSDAFAIYAANWDSNDQLYLYYEQNPKKVSDDNYYFSYYDETKKKLISTELDLISASSGAMPTDMLVLSEDTVLFNCYFELIQYNYKTKETIATYSNSQRDTIQGYSVYENTLAFCDQNIVRLYDLTTGKETGQISNLPQLQIDTTTVSYSDFSDNARLLQYDSDGALYILDSTGIYRYLSETSMLEQIIDGNLTSLSMPSIEHFKFLKTNDIFSLVGYNTTTQTFQLLSYQYDDSVPSLPEKELTIYSLKENPTIRQAIGLYMRQHSDVHISLQIGITDDTTSEKEAIRTLSTELLAGNSADLLLLDSLPIKEYLEKGVLYNIFPIINELIENGELYPQIASCYKQYGNTPDQTLYAVPARFQIPMIHGDSKAIHKIKNLTQLAEWLDSQKDTYNLPLSLISTEQLINTFYPVYTDIILKEDNTIDEQELRTFLSVLKTFFDSLPEEYRINNEAYMDSQPHFDFNALNWYENDFGLNIGNVTYYRATFAPYTANLKKEGDLTTLFEKQTFIPCTILGINASTTELDLAQDFLKFVLSKEVLETSFHDGLPVSTQAFESEAAVPKQEKEENYNRYMYYGTSDSNEKSIAMEVKYPTDKALKKITTILTSVTTPVIIDQNILDIIMETSNEYFYNQITLEDAITTISQKVTTYLKE